MVYPTPVKDGRRLGYWLTHPCEYTSFDYTKYFNTPPYPSFLEYIATDLEKWGTPMMQSPTSQFQTMLKYADTKNIKIAMMLGYMNPTNTTYLKSFCNSVKSHKSISSIGAMTEYAGFDITIKSNWTTLRDVVNSYGYPFVSYRPDKATPFMSRDEGIFYMGHTNYPIQDPINTLDIATDTASVGISSGYWGYPNELQYWTHEAIDNIVNHNISKSLDVRLYDGVCLKEWDDLTIRNWIWNSPNYQKNFILSTGSTPTPPPSGRLNGTLVLAGLGVVTIAGLYYLMKE